MPSNDLGKPGDHYLDRDSSTLWGPKDALTNEWLISTVLDPAGGSDKQFQVNASGLLAGTAKLVLDGTTGEVDHLGKPAHKEDYADFIPSGASGSARVRSQWNKIQTTNNTATVVNSVSAPIATFGDCIITIIAELSIGFSSSGTKGGNMTGKAVFKRSSGTLSLVKFKDLSDTDFYTGTAVSFAIAANGNETIELKGTGISSQNITWVSSLHIQVAQV
jgi:hypothetical protein